MSGQFEAVVEVDRPVEEVFAYLADGRNDPQFSPRVLTIERIPDTPTAVGTVFRSAVKDAGMKTAREFRITELEAPVKLRWAEVSKNSVTVSKVATTWKPWPTAGLASVSSTISRAMVWANCWSVWRSPRPARTPLPSAPGSRRPPRRRSLPADASKGSPRPPLVTGGGRLRRRASRTGQGRHTTRDTTF